MRFFAVLTCLELTSDKRPTFLPIGSIMLYSYYVFSKTYPTISRNLLLKSSVCVVASTNYLNWHKTVALNIELLSVYVRMMR